VLGPLAPPELGEDAPELEEEGGVGTDGVVGVLAEGQPINANMAATTAPAIRGRENAVLNLLKKVSLVFIVVAMPFPHRSRASGQKTM
jgi:hypothetical protein